MSLFDKLRSGNGPAMPHPNSGASAHPMVAMAATRTGVSNAPAATAPREGRLSNGLKEFLVQLDGIGHGHLLDLGPARQTTITFFIERGYKVYTEDLLTGWKHFLDSGDQNEGKRSLGKDQPEVTAASRAEKFLENTLGYANQTFDAVLMWDLLDYLDNELVTRLMARVTSLVRDGGVVLAIFHMRKPESFNRYRVLDAQHLELIPASCPFAPQHVYQNREISNLFSRFRSSKMFVGRDQLREGLFSK